MEAWALQFPHGSCKQGLNWITHPSSGQAPRSPLPDLGAGLGTSGGRELRASEFRALWGVEGLFVSW